MLFSVNVRAEPTFFSPYIGPYLTLLQPHSQYDDGTADILDPSTNIIINYELKHRPKEFVAGVRFRRTGGEWETKFEDLYSPATALIGKVHHVTLDNLTANTEYQYQIIGPNNTYGKTYTFTTASDNQQSSRFLVIGDMQDQDKQQRWQDIADTIVDEHLNDFDFIITVGDMVKDDIPENGDRFHWWKVFFDKGKALFARKPIYPAMGNHDSPQNPSVYGHKEYSSNPEDTLSFRKYFYLNTDMSKPDYYSFTRGNACFISVNSEIPVFYGLYPERDKLQKVKQQANWLEKAVSTASQCPWSFAYWHVPPINPAGGKDEVKFLRPYASLFNYKLDWTICGHVHEYQRLKPLTANDDALFFKKQYGRKEDNGVGYLISPPSGQWPRNNESDNMDQLAFYPHNEHGVAYEIGFIIVQTNENNIDIKTYGMGDVNGRAQPKGYREENDRTKRLLDRVSYSK